MSEKINKTYTPQELSEAILVLEELGIEHAATLLKLLFEKNYRLVKCH